MQFEKVGCGLLQEAFQSEGEWVVCWKSGGENKEGLVLENSVNTEAFQINKNECSIAKKETGKYEEN